MEEKNMKRIEFHDREKETKEIMKILDMEPSLITFIYGPINSGKTTLINHLTEELSDEYVVFYINLRTKFLSSYDDFIESLFEMEMETDGSSRKRKETLAELVSSVTKVIRDGSASSIFMISSVSLSLSWNAILFMFVSSIDLLQPAHHHPPLPARPRTVRKARS